MTMYQMSIDTGIDESQINRYINGKTKTVNGDNAELMLDWIFTMTRKRLKYSELFMPRDECRAKFDKLMKEAKFHEPTKHTK